MTREQKKAITKIQNENVKGHNARELIGGYYKAPSWKPIYLKMSGDENEVTISCIEVTEDGSLLDLGIKATIKNWKDILVDASPKLESMDIELYNVLLNYLKSLSESSVKYKCGPAARWYK